MGRQQVVNCIIPSASGDRLTYYNSILCSMVLKQKMIWANLMNYKSFDKEVNTFLAGISKLVHISHSVAG